MEKHILEKVNRWLESDIEEKDKEEIKALMADKDTLADAFYKDLEFGTGGLRGIMGIGSNRMNQYTVAMATQGFSNYLLKVFKNQEISVSIAYDSRINSHFFADTAACVFSANGITAYLFEEIRPTPELSFSIRHLRCQGGVVITASHNPKNYNGYKAYWKDGAQLISPHDQNVIDEVKKIQHIDEINFTRNEEKIIFIGEPIDNSYLATAKKQLISSQELVSNSELKIVYTPIHGTGSLLVNRLLKEMGFTNIYTVEAQTIPDGNFPTVKYPNPEEKEAMKMALALAKEKEADLVLATDPDADRVGVGIKNTKGIHQLLNGNQTACLLAYYLLDYRKKTGKLNGKQYIVKTIVTSTLLDKIAGHYEVDCHHTLTGFKYIASLIKGFEEKKEFIMGAEESYGYLIGDFVRDKDGITACAVIAEMAAYAKSCGISLFEMLIEIYQKFGFFKESQFSFTKEGRTGAAEIKKIMADLRKSPPEAINQSPLMCVKDYQAGTEKDIKTGTETKLSLPSSNVLQFIYKNNNILSVRPSGTEPKIKFYIGVNAPLKKKELFYDVDARLEKQMQNIREEISQLF